MTLDAPFQRAGCGPPRGCASEIKPPPMRVVTRDDNHYKLGMI